MIIVIPGNPVAKARPRFCRVGKGVRTYDCQAKENKAVKLSLMEQWQGMDIIAGPVELIIWFCVSRPKGHYGTGKNAQMVKSSSPKHPVTRFDIDNYLKFIFDCMNGIVFKDDCQVVEVTAKKEYTESPRTVIHIHELDNAIM